MGQTQTNIQTNKSKQIIIKTVFFYLPKRRDLLSRPWHHHTARSSPPGPAHHRRDSPERTAGTMTASTETQSKGTKGTKETKGTKGEKGTKGKKELKELKDLRMRVKE